MVVEAEHIIFLQNLLEVLLRETDHAVLAIICGEVEPLFCLAGGQQIDPHDEQVHSLHLGEVSFHFSRKPECGKAAGRLQRTG